ncbi:uncharacterized protein DS421_17g574850 [Arachis hypogaea]|nr:uncharacterized protein DS421_17g574850 [Arachis hypogaea]
MAKMSRMKLFFFLCLICSFLLISAIAINQSSNNDIKKQGMHVKLLIEILVH